MNSPPRYIHFQDYAEKIIDLRLATYPEATSASHVAVSYCLLGLIGEVDEIPMPLRTEDMAKVRDELGDVAWYIAMVWFEMGAAWSADVPAYASPTGLRDRALNDAVVDLLRQCAKLSQAYKRVMRDGTDLKTCRAAWEGVARQWVWTCVCAGFYPYAVIDANLEKLKDRQTRGVLHGAGDGR